MVTLIFEKYTNLKNTKKDKNQIKKDKLKSTFTFLRKLIWKSMKPLAMF